MEQEINFDYFNTPFRYVSNIFRNFIRRVRTSNVEEGNALVQGSPASISRSNTPLQEVIRKTEIKGRSSTEINNIIEKRQNIITFIWNDSKTRNKLLSNNIPLFLISVGTAFFLPPISGGELFVALTIIFNIVPVCLLLPSHIDIVMKGILDGPKYNDEQKKRRNDNGKWILRLRDEDIMGVSAFRRLIPSIASLILLPIAFGGISGAFTYYTNKDLEANKYPTWGFYLGLGISAILEFFVKESSLEHWKLKKEWSYSKGREDLGYYKNNQEFKEGITEFAENLRVEFENTLEAKSKQAEIEDAVSNEREAAKKTIDDKERMIKKLQGELDNVITQRKGEEKKWGDEKQQLKKDLKIKEEELEIEKSKFQQMESVYKIDLNKSSEKTAELKLRNKALKKLWSEKVSNKESNDIEIKK